MYFNTARAVSSFFSLPRPSHTATHPKMRLPIAFAVAAVLCCFSTGQALRILLNNDDGWASANIRETYRLLREAGHEVLLVAPVVDNSGQGGRSVFTRESTLMANGAFDSVLKGAPSLGHDKDDFNIWYYNGTPAACTFVNLDYVMQEVWPKVDAPDLLVSGPNVGQNLGGFLYTLSGTMGATTAAIGRGVPAIAFSAGSNGGQRSYTDVKSPTEAGLTDPATISANLTVKLVQQLIDNTPQGERLLPLGYGISVNYPDITSFKDDSCIDPPFVRTRMTGGALSTKAVYNNATGVFSGENIDGAGLNACIDGNCTLRGETDVALKGCETAVTIFSIDYDAPTGSDTSKIEDRLRPLLRMDSSGPTAGTDAQNVLTR
ncbi:5'/3'-nucleotidase sure [Phyllosticta citriasiana]|uniref:5'/3'-nucleotidase sure n=1 Tax=Phyllosticta citriasiana TaxID=595635 RepID=A0ABR1KNC7_9PEZI